MQKKSETLAWWKRCEKQDFECALIRMFGDEPQFKDYRECKEALEFNQVRFIVDYSDKIESCKRILAGESVDIVRPDFICSIRKKPDFRLSKRVKNAQETI